MTYNEIKSGLFLEPRRINEYYDKFIATGPNNYTSVAEYSSICELLIKNYIGYDDYLHSNNLIQIFRLNMDSSQNVPSWFKYYSMIIYSKRSIKYYLDNPKQFWDVINDLGSLPDDTYVRGLDNVIVGTLEFYKEEYAKYSSFLEASLKKFVRYYRIFIRQYSETADAHIKEIESLLNGKEYKELESKKIEDVDELLENYNVDKDSATGKKVAKQIEDLQLKYYGDGIELSDDDYKKKIFVIGGDQLLKKPDIIYGIGKRYNVNKGQFVIYNDYDTIPTLGSEIVKKTQYNDNCIGVIFGSVPHSTSGNAGFSSLITRLQQDEGFPTCIKCETYSAGSKLKMTRTSFNNALKDLIIKYRIKNR